MVGKKGAFFSSFVYVFILTVSISAEDCHLFHYNNSTTTSFPPFVVFIDHSQSSRTNGIPYHRKVGQVGMFTFNVTSQMYTTVVDGYGRDKLNVSLSTNGTHACVLSDFIDVSDFYGNYKQNKTCTSTCLSIEQFYVKQSMQVFYRKRDTYSLGSWYQSDYLDIYITPNTNILCHYTNQSFDYWPSFNPDFSNVETGIKLCPIGQGCRITYARKDYTVRTQLFIGCEGDDGKLGGCSECMFNEDLGWPTYTWREMCRHCCFTDLCNSPAKCEKFGCDLQKIIKDSSAVNFKSQLVVSLTISLLVMFHTI